jgi:aspartyl-tRNA(Asn)/glutamyl-tRNA(Gln) amidotransferase subunit C
MPLTPEDIAHVARLARLGLSDEERRRYGAQLDAILEHMTRLNDVDTSPVGETAQVGELVNVWREDEPQPSLSVERALANAPAREGDFFRVGAIQE